jgi:2,3-dihydro-2,3-dihydroxybenzoate dehydrogenase
VGHSGIEGAIAVVTGAGQGIGRAVARALAEEGAVVAALDLDPDRARATAADLAAEGRTAAAYGCDVRDPAAVEDAVDAVERDLGPVAHAVNVAGVLRTGPVVAAADADWAELFAVNATGVFHVSRAAARRMVPRGTGTITTVASNAAGVPRADMAGYAASKAAAAMFTKSLGLELAPHGIRCIGVSVEPGETTLQRMPWGASSSPSDLVNMAAAALEAA